MFFDWSTDMERAELYVLGRLAQIRSELPSTTQFAVHRLTFAAFPILGVSLTSSQRKTTELWEIARYELSPGSFGFRVLLRSKLLEDVSPNTTWWWIPQNSRHGI